MEVSALPYTWKARSSCSGVLAKDKTVGGCMDFTPFAWQCWKRRAWKLWQFWSNSSWKAIVGAVDVVLCLPSL